ncbi:hypothetical protein A4157S3_380004 [Escherichia coli]|jgi:hypothetical protein|uniref:Uncharacterized protein n=1 Tax=Escherichia coli O25b:H4 TaxID=941280 RepID=A0A192CHA2_ECO25|nr:hypothetical protein WLH_03815 [Escherichia coli O25b:H4]OSK99467.1 hypothetical protein ECWG_03010 [Escherichia coli E1002]OSL02518.1 hypothetical protein ECUG_04415 [Escherichia coli H296]OSL54013.1 hypothetical protein EASG_05510 [Escherichia coli H383]CRL87794.1 hypothetical protein AL505_100158 [Escherichia coli]
MLIWWLKLAADKECEVDTMEWSDVQAGDSLYAGL